MNVVIEIHYKAASHLIQAASFPLRGKRSEQVALEWWKQIKKEMSYHTKLEKVIIDGEHDITKLVVDLENDEWNKTTNDDLPF